MKKKDKLITRNYFSRFTTVPAQQAEEIDNNNKECYDYLNPEITDFLICEETGGIIVKLNNGQYFVNVYDMEKTGTIEEVINFFRDAMKSEMI